MRDRAAYQRHICMCVVRLDEIWTHKKNEPSHIPSCITNKNDCNNRAIPLWVALREFGISHFFSFFFLLFISWLLNFLNANRFAEKNMSNYSYLIQRKMWESNQIFQTHTKYACYVDWPVLNGCHTWSFFASASKETEKNLFLAERNNCSWAIIAPINSSHSEIYTSFALDHRKTSLHICVNDLWFVYVSHGIECQYSIHIDTAIRKLTAFIISVFLGQIAPLSSACDETMQLWMSACVIFSFLWC